MIENYDIEKKFSYLGKDFITELLMVSVIKTFPTNIQLVREGQYVKYIPIVLSGLVKVYTQFEEKELLLYYIKPDQSCIMSFSSCINNDKSKIFAVTEEESAVLLLPSDKIAKWLVDFPSINMLFYQQYDLRYAELVDTIHQMLYHKLDKRLLDYLLEKVSVTGKNPIKISHKEIANDLGTAREVVSRLVKKLERQNILKQYHDSIELIKL
ncbi:MAG: Crp/Fnr family transcriptional regulator [Saprospiraceae bacterium]|nr:Crp/Fnr family transcriptional regulator [Saprospiraceae bacterium]MBK8636564.1 Crp/Fnr family transcriptional regulator [Saprospiraceae bacterium]